jgi:23S rRNA (cytosine1962-C5)-methyltransferase
MAQLVLLPGKDRSLARRHPWIFAAAVDRLGGRARAGDTVEVVAANGRPLAKAAWSPESKIRARVWTFDPQETVDDAFFKRRIQAAVDRRHLTPELKRQQGLRLIHGESDGLPGLIADRYDDTVVLQLTATGPEKWRRAILGALQRVTGCSRIYERSDSNVRRLEGLEPVTGWVLGEAPAQALNIVENGVRIKVDVVAGHKTGFYLDQRDNRLLTRELAADRATLNCFCYTGDFRCRRSPVAPAAYSRSTPPGRPWRPPPTISRSTHSSMRAAPNGAKPTSSANCARSRARVSAST